MKTVALYSGGVDSYCMAVLEDPDILLHVLMDGRYGHQQLAYLRTPPGMESRLRFAALTELARYELPGNMIVPARNAYLALLGANYGDRILMGSVAGNLGNDKDQRFADLVNALFDHVYGPQDLWLPDGRTVRLELPVLHLTKRQLVEATLAAGHPPELVARNTFSCYFPAEDGSPCGQCKPCGKKWAALAANGIDPGYNGRPGLRPYWDEIASGKAIQRGEQNVADVRDAWLSEWSTP